MNQHSLVVVVSAVSLLPTCATQQVSFNQDVRPIINENCKECHAAPDGFGYKVSGLNMDSYESLMQGTVYGPVIIAGDSRRSILNKLVEGRAGHLKDVLREANKESMTEQQVDILREWVNQGAQKN